MRLAVALLLAATPALAAAARARAAQPAQALHLDIRIPFHGHARRGPAPGARAALDWGVLPASLLALALFASPPAGAVTLRLAAPAPEGTAWVTDCFEPYIKRVVAATGGRARFKPYWGATLGDEAAMLRLLLEEKVEIWAGSFGSLAARVPELHALELPFLFGSDAEVDAVLRASPARAEIQALLRKAGLVPLIFTEVGWRSFAGKQAFRTPADLRGVVVRSQDTPLHLEMWRRLEARPRVLGITELMTAFESGSVTALDQSPVLLFATSWYRHTPVYTRSRHIYQPALAVARLAYLDGLPGAVARALARSGADVEPGCFDGLRRQAREVEAYLEKERVQVVDLTAAERAGFERHLRPVWEAFRKKTSPAGRRLLGAIEAALAKHRRR